MRAMSKECLIQAQLTIIAALLKNTVDNLCDTVFEGEDLIESLLDTLVQGSNVSVLMVKQIIKDADHCDCC